MNATRLPGKVLKRVMGKTLLEHLLKRLQRAWTLDAIVVATTTNPADDAIARLLQRQKTLCFRGSEQDVLDRYYRAAKEFGIGDVVRITADCPLMDPAVVDVVVGAYEKKKRRLAYVSNINPPTFPDGMDVEVFSFNALEEAWNKARLPSEREHVTPYIRNHPDKFPSFNVAAPRDLSAFRLTVDEPRDLALIRRIFWTLYPKKRLFRLEDIVRLLHHEPRLVGINAGIVRNEGMLKSLEEDKRFSRQPV